MPNPLSALLARRRATWRPAMYHGHGRSRNFFEGWYFKFVDPTERHVWAVIPGVFLQLQGNEAYAFVQTLNGATGETHFHRYPLSEFRASETEFDVRIGPNRFRTDGFTLDIDRDGRRLRGALRFDGVTPWPVTLTSPGIMNWYAFMPFMECYHGVLSLDHAVAGRLAIDGTDIDFDGGRGYIEKDWGQAFPKGWIWMQTNHFTQPGTCLTASVARIPWLGTAFRGFIVGLWHAGQLHRFATYNGAQITALTLTDTHVHWTMQNERHTLAIEAERSDGGLLHAPMRSAMVQRVLESLTATVAVRFAERASGRVLFEDRGRHAGLEVGGDVAVVLDA